MTLWGWRDQVGQALVEFALCAPVLLFTVMATVQLGVFVGMEFNVMQVTRETVRWLAIDPHTTDADALAHAQAIRRPGMLASSFASITASPPCAGLDGSGRCADRVDAQEVAVRISYDVSHVLFFPAQLSLGPLEIRIPTTLPEYTAWAPIE